ncbi:phage portal protein [Pseudoclavibacter sp. AY1H1]|uniref:phage portal protein n=1 Tax=Pseudoclavibacter sp. AY1H1 TaxID=2080584 RepID=UPI0015E29159|nr:phage portal protein [Pseudoclavibacter sp. AY1H1]
MDATLAQQRLRYAEQKINFRRPTVQKRERYVRGIQELPFAPNGVNKEYEQLRDMSIANWLDLWSSAPVQRLRMDGIRAGLDTKDKKPKAGEIGEIDKAIWRDVFQANKWDVRQSHVYASLMRHGRGIASVWPNKKNPKQPIVRYESFELVHIEMDPDDPLTPLWAAKVYQVDDLATGQANAFILPNGMSRTKTIGIVYDDQKMIRFERGGVSSAFGGGWEKVFESTHPMGEVPFALYDYKVKDNGEPWSGLDHMIPQQDALNTVRFNTLLAMQFSAFRQRAVSGFDPRVLDAEGNIVYRTNTDGQPLLDANGQPIPIIHSPGKAGVDRILAFPGEGTKVWDLPESDLGNYIKVHENFLVNFFATGQIPPQYLLSRMANLSGDALAGAESTFASLLEEIKLSAGEGNEQVAKLAWKARGEDHEWDPSAECQWADTEARSFSQIVDALTKLIAVDFPHQAAFEMIPGATSQKVERWMQQMDAEALSSNLTRVAREFRGAGTPPPAEVDEDELEPAV